MKIGLQILPGPSPRLVVDLAVSAEQSGFDSVWYPDHLVSTTMAPSCSDRAACFDVFTVLGAVAIRTERVIIGSAVLSGTIRHPSIAAQAIATLDRLSNGRVIVGIGAGLPWEMEQFGFDTSMLTSRLREGLIITKKLLSGSEVDFSGRFYKLTKARLGITSVQKPHPPILLASKGPKMMKIGAELADGFILGFPATLETCREYCQEARKLFKEMGRSTLPDVVVINRIAISNDVDDALRALESSKNLIVRAPEEVRKAGFPELASRLEKQLSETKDIGRVSVSLSHLIPNEVVEKLSIVGPAEECVKKLRKYAELGIKHIILADYSPNQKWAFEVFQKEILPKIKDKEVE